MRKSLPTITERAEELQALLRTKPNGKKRVRLQALYLLASGQAASQLGLAKLLAVHRHTIQTWLKQYEAGGLIALLAIRKAPGKAPAVSPAMITKLQERLADVRGFGSYSEVQPYLAQTHKVELAYSTVHKLVRYKLKAKLKAPRRAHPKKSPRKDASSKRRSRRNCKPA
jgi:transposase